MAETSSRTPYKAVLIELKNTVLHSSMENIQLPTNTFKSILCCGATVEYQCGRITEEQYFARLASDFGHSPEEIETAILGMRKSLRVYEAVLESLVAMKAQSEGRLKLHAATNLSQQDYALVKGLGIDSSLFDQVFVSSEVGMQKPELRFYRRFLDELDLQAEQVVLVDDDAENMLAALSMGLQDVFSLDDPVSRSILNLLKLNPFESGTQYLHQKTREFSALTKTGVSVKEIFDADPIGRGTQFIQQNAQNLPSFTHTGVPVKENFAQLLILDLTGNRYVRAVTEMYQCR
jgi:FMN phosphatase YigB (HAD superfamily)